MVDGGGFPRVEKLVNVIDCYMSFLSFYDVIHGIAPFKPNSIGKAVDNLP